VSADSVGRVSAEMSVEYRPIVSVNTRPRYRPSVGQYSTEISADSVGRDVGRVSAEISAECRPIVTVNIEISAECRSIVLA